MLPRCGRAAHICEANCICNKFFLLQLHFLKLANSQLDCFYETSYKFGQGNGAIAARWQAKAGVEPPFAGRERPFFLRTMIANHEPQANKKFFDPAIFQKCWRGSGRAALIAARRQRNPCAILLAHGAGGEKSDSFSRRGEQERNVINLKRLLNGKQNVWKYQNGEEKSDSDGREKDV